MVRVSVCVLVQRITLVSHSMCPLLAYFHGYLDIGPSHHFKVIYNSSPALYIFYNKVFIIAMVTSPSHPSIHVYTVANSGRIDRLFQVIPDQEGSILIGEMLSDGLLVVEMPSSPPSTPLISTHPAILLSPDTEEGVISGNPLKEKRKQQFGRNASYGRSLPGKGEGLILFYFLFFQRELQIIHWIVGCLPLLPLGKVLARGNPNSFYWVRCGHRNKLY